MHPLLRSLHLISSKLIKEERDISKNISLIEAKKEGNNKLNVYDLAQIHTHKK